MFKPVVKSAVLALWLAVCYPPTWLAKRFNKIHLYDWMLLHCSKGVLAITGVKLHVTGEPVKKRPMLLVSNHISYLDVIILSSQLRVRFTPKADIEKWPVVGSICKLCDAVFIDRRPNKVTQMKENLKTALEQGKVISLFPEATTGDGIHMLPFKAGFFSLAEEDFGDENLVIQPAAITYTKIRQLPVDRTQWPDIAWYGDMDFMPHLFKLFELAPLEAEIVFLPPVEVRKENMDRKALALECHDRISQAIEQIRARTPKVIEARQQAKLLAGTQSS